MRTTTLRRALLVGGLGCLLASPAPAETFHVKPGQSIQTAISQAHAGDTVLVASGTYTETLLIPQQLVGLKLIGKGSVVVDARPNAPSGSGTALTIQAFDVVVRNLVLAHPRKGTPPAGHDESGYGVRITNKGVTLEDVTVLDTTTWGIRADGDDLTLEDVTLIGSGSGIRANGSGLRARDVSVAGAWDAAFTSQGDDAEFVGCSLVAQYGPALEISGSSLVIDRCTLGGSQGLIASGEALTITRNALTGFERGAYVSGIDVVFDRNVISRSFAIGAEISGENLQVTKNRVDDHLREIGLIVNGEVGEISGNVFGRTQAESLIVSGFAVEIEGNRFAGTNTPRDAAIDVRGSNHVLTKNVVRGSAGPGIVVRDAQNVELVKNKIDGGASVGIAIGPGCSQTRLTANTVKKHFGEGIQNWGTTTTLLGNTSLGNLRGNLTNASSNGATIVDLGGNSLGAGVSSPGSAPQPMLYDWI